MYCSFSTRQLQMNKLVLETAATIVLMPKAWTQGYLARDESGCAVDFESSYAACFCAAGAIQRAALELNGNHEDAKLAIYAANRKVPNGITHYNDAPGRTAHEVAAILLKAAYDE